MLLQPISELFTSSVEFSQLKNRLKGGDPLHIEGIAPSAFPLLIASLFKAEPQQYLIITENSQKMQELYLDLFCLIGEDKLFTLPPWETLPYEFVSPSERIEKERITALFKLLHNEPAVIVASLESILRKIPHKDFFIQKGFKLEVGDEYPFDDLIELIVSYGFSREFRVEGYGQFSVKGGIIDIFLPSLDNPVRIDFFGDTLDSIREFDIGSQISYSSHNEVTLYPRKELVLMEDDKKKLLSLLQNSHKKGLELPDDIVMQIENNAIDKIHGIEDLFPAIMESALLESYLSPQCRIIYIEPADLITRKNMLERMFNEYYHKKNTLTLCIPPAELIDIDAYDRLHDKAVHMQVFTSSPNALQFKMKSLPNYHGKIKQLREDIAERLGDGWKIVVTTAFEGQARRLYDLLSDFNPDSDFDTITPESKVNIIISPFREGVEIHDIKTMVLTDHDIFGKSYRKKKQFKRKGSRPIESFLDLDTGDYIVHINHGIGIFRGIERMTATGIERDFLMIEYADGDKLYVSLDQITLVQKYIGMDGRKPKIDYLGKKSAWNRIKKKVLESVEEIAKELIALYSERNALKGFPFPPDTMWQEEFESQFEYEETPDQITAIEDVKDDMESVKPMDRLVCGDVGFGKTEVAIRASFKSVMAGKQVALLVPTTVLAIEHYSNFNKRFSEYPISVEMVSRFRSRAEIIKIKEKLKMGEVDIIIGTHALLAKDVRIKNLGLLIIDEEQRFGVKHKEQLKTLKTLVDVLTLTATPIPRTLHMSLAGIRDLSIISTPPENRQAIDTYVMEDNPDIMRNAIINEINRDGQIFFVHNRVQTIEAQVSLLQELVPEAAICYGHGQMHEHELEEVMIDFMNKKYNILVSTTIIESGIDMPNVNTIMINRADTFGLSQLYQLKGRVGRSARKAYAYLFYPRHIPLNEDAQKRLQVISEYSELGSGFKIAMKDMEIRGAGNILGKEQSGSIMEVGFDLYTQMLEDAVNRLKGEKVSTSFRTPVFFNVNVFIPDHYIPDERQKIEFYKRFESCMDMKEIDLLEKEMIDRFGLTPEEVQILVELERIRTMASKFQLGEILEETRAIRIKISAESTIDPENLIKHIAKDNRLSIDVKDPEILLFKPHSKESQKKMFELKNGCNKYLEC